MGELLKLARQKNWRVEYNLNADDGVVWQETKEFRTLSGAHAHVTRWFQKAARGGIIQITRIGDRV